MKKGWQKKRLGDFCAITSGGTPSKDNPRFWVGDVPFVSARDLKSDRIETAFLHISREAVEQSATKLAPIGSLLMLVRGMGLANGIQIGEVTAPVAFNQDLRAIQPPLGSVLSRFLLLGLRNSFINGEGERALSSAAHGTLKIDADVLREIEIPVPPLAEQQRIVGLLDEAFEGLATAKANAEKNLQNARALFESHLQSVFTQRGPGWVERNLGDLCQIKTGKKDVNEGNPEGKYPFFTCAAAHTFSDNYSFDTEALLVAGNGNVGQVSYYSGKFEAYQRTYVLFDFKGVTAKYLFRVLDKRLSATVSKQKLGNTMPYIKIGMLTDFVVPVPPQKEQGLVAEHLNAFAEETQRLAHLYERKLAALEALKKSLLHQAFTGEL